MLKEKTSFGKTKIGIERTTVVINGESVVERIYRKVKVDGHVEAVLDAM